MLTCAHHCGSAIERPWCQKTDGLDEDAMRRAKEKAARGLVHLEEAIKAEYGKEVGERTTHLVL